jgi:hypothetical protein
MRVRRGASHRRSCVVAVALLAGLLIPSGASAMAEGTPAAPGGQPWLGAMALGDSLHFQRFPRAAPR